MHRNAEIWEKRHERLEALRRQAFANFEQASRAPGMALVVLQRRIDWTARYDALERRVFEALSIAKGWRRA
jgi:hypothetical protein